VLCGSRLCGGPLGFSASAGGGSRVAVKVFGSSLKKLGSGLGARPVAPPFRQRAPIAFFSAEFPHFSNSGNLRFVARSHYNRPGTC
jgi:hypothetical protein